MDTSCLQYALTEEERQQFETDGFLVVREVLPPERVAELIPVVDRLDAEYRPKMELADSEMLNLFDFIGKDALFLPLLDWPKTFAKVFGLTPDSEPAVWHGTTQPESYLENVAIDASGALDFADKSHTENSRAVISAAAARLSLSHVTVAVRDLDAMLDFEYGRLVGQLSKAGYDRALSVDMVPMEGVDHGAELRKIRLLLDSLL